MTTITAYLTFPGSCEEAFQFYKTVFGGEFITFDKFSKMPPQEGVKLSEKDLDKIMHVSLQINEATVLMGSDSGGEWAAKTVIGNNITLSLNADSKTNADELFGCLSDGGNAIMPMDQTFWGSYFGMCTDKFGINWMISFGGAPKE